MKGSETIIRQLNVGLTNELTAINQYFLHARMLKDWGFNILGDKIYQESIGEMRHADMIIQRILFLEGLPNLQNLHKLTIGENVEEILKHDLAFEYNAREDVLAAIRACEAENDYHTRRIFTDILADAEEHIDFLETEAALFKKLGEKNYLQTQTSTPLGG
jgi:bacterioferritin